MLKAYKFITSLSEPFLKALLKKRLSQGKEDAVRIHERKGMASQARPLGNLIWIHAASVGESQSALILIEKLQNPETHILITTGTKTSAAFLEKRLNKNCIHQFYPLDHPKWVKRFLDHWKPDICLWMESELWPNMLMEIQQRRIPAALINARLSEKSYRNWKRFGTSIQKILSAFSIILAQTEKEAKYYAALGANNIQVTDNLKYSAFPLDYNQADYDTLSNATRNRPIWLYASTHAGEEELACAVHQKLKMTFPDILTIIVPRHPDRGSEIFALCKGPRLEAQLRSMGQSYPENHTDIYIADTIGELGLFYALSPIACIGRSFSDDGGGGHNPIEAAQMGCAVLHGRNIQNLADIFAEMDATSSAINLDNKDDLATTIHALLSDPEALKKQQGNAIEFAKRKTSVIDNVMLALDPLLQNMAK